jgi:outer membrane protein assembly factor BamB
MKISGLALSIVAGVLLALAAVAGGQQPGPDPAPPAPAAMSAPTVREVLRKLGSPRGICAILGDSRAELAIELAKASQLQVYAQLPDAERVEAARRAADSAGMLNTRVYIEKGNDARIHLADNLADAVVVRGEASDRAVKDEVLRVLRPGGTAWLGTELVAKPQPEGTDQWSHPYHGPDNNPQSLDRVARAPYLTQFLAEPWYCPMPEMTVAAGGRIFKAFGSRAFLRPQWPMLDTLIAINGYNGTILWKRPLDPNFMIHRNTMIATPDTLYLGDAASCKLLDAATGGLKGEIHVPEGVSDGPVWKWMAMDKGVLYAMVGEKEPPGDKLQGQGFRGAGWPWWNVDRYAWGFGRTLLAIDPRTKKILWHHRELEPIDTRAVCMKAGRIYFYSHPNHLGCLDAATGKLVWRSDDREVLQAIGEHHPAQFPGTGFATSAYLKCGDDALYFAGPQRTKLVAVSTVDGKLLWQYPKGAFQLVLRDEGLYAMGALDPSQLFDPKTGQIRRQLFHRAGCTRATGSVDRIFVRGGGDGTFSWDTAAQKILPIAPMRPACHDGVVVAGGLLYWGPWMCGCNLSLIGIVCVAPAGEFDFSKQATEAERLERASEEPAGASPLQPTADDWPTYRKDNVRSARSERPVAEKAAVMWESRPERPDTSTAPVTVGNLVFVGGSDGVVRALDAQSGKPKWTAYTGGAIRVPPTIADGRAMVGSADGWIYAFDAAGGRPLWRFRAAPVERKIPVYGSLYSTWPVGGGVLVEGPVAYAAAGIANYDGTHVYALDAATGKIRWQNNTSGITEGGQGSGAGVQGDLLLHRGKLYLAGGNRVPLACYDATNGAFQAVRPAALPYAKDPRGPRGHSLFLRGDEKVAVSGSFPLYTRPEDVHYIDQAELPCPPAALAVITGGLGMVVPAQGEGGKDKAIWAGRPFQENAAVALAANAAIVAGTDRRVAKPDASPAETYGIAALEIKTGKVLWKHPLPAGPVRWGVAIDREGRVVVSLRDGRVLCFGDKGS